MKEVSIDWEVWKKNWKKMMSMQKRTEYLLSETSLSFNIDVATCSTSSTAEYDSIYERPNIETRG